MDCYTSKENAIKELREAGFETIKETESVFLATNPALDKVIYFSVDYSGCKVDSVSVTDKCTIKRSLSSHSSVKMHEIRHAIQHANEA